MVKYNKGWNTDLTEVGISVNNISLDKVSVLRDIIQKDYQDTVAGKNVEQTRITIERGNMAYQFNLDICSSLQIESHPRFDIDYAFLHYPFKYSIDDGVRYNLEVKYFISEKKEIKLPPKQETDVTKYFKKWQDEVIKNQEDYELDEIIIRNKKDGKLYAVKGLKPISVE